MTADTIIAYTIKGKFNLTLKLIFKMIIIDYKLTTKRRHILVISRGKVEDLHNRPHSHVCSLPERSSISILKNTPLSTLGK